MRLALREAERAALEGEVPVGCVLVAADGTVVSVGRNNREKENDPTGHAEIVALRDAARTLSSWRLDDLTIYVTLEPCAMCAGALVHARVPRVVYGCSDPKGGAVDTFYGIGKDGRLNHRFTVTAGVCEAECRQVLQQFFSALRASGKK
jgi:tRNA(adenine34) deaminase